MKKFIIFTFLILTFSICKSYGQWSNYFYYIQDEAEYFISDLQFPDANTGWGCGDARSYSYPFTYWGVVINSTDGGLSWRKIIIPTTKNMYSIQPVNSQTVFVTGDSSEILKTTNAGVSWTILHTPVISSAPFGWTMYFIDPNTGWVSSTISSASPHTYSTTDGGNSWSPVSAAGFSKLYFFNSLTGFAFNRTGLYSTTNSGSAWNLEISDSLITDFTFLNQSTGWCFSSHSAYSSFVKGKGYTTTNSGANWNVIYSNDSLSNPTRVKFFNSLTGYANNLAGSPSAISETTDGGASWYNPTDFRYDFTNLYFLNTSTGWTGGTAGFYCKTTSGPGAFVNPYFAKLISYHNSNQLNSRIDSYGFSYPLNPSSPGTEWPKGSGKYIMYYAGLCIGAKVNGGIRIANGLYGGDFFFGHIDNNGMAAGRNLGEYGVYTIKSGDGPGTPDWDNWPVSQGAPTYNGQPLLYGNMTSFTSIADGYLNVYSDPLYAEVKLLVYTFNSPSPYDNILFAKYTIKNRSGFNWDSAYVSIIADPDIGTPTDDLAGSDKNLSLAYAYNSSNTDPIYGSAPPALGIKILESPVSNQAQSSVSFFPTNFFPCQNDPVIAQDIYNYLKGVDKCGNPFMYQGTPQKFVYNGEPEAGTGWLDINPLDVRCTVTSGPFSLANNETTTFTVAVIVARGSSNLNSVTLLKQIAGSLPIGIAPISQTVPHKFSLSQNYPNPFNPSTKIKFDLPSAGDTYMRPVQVRLSIFNILGQVVATLVNFTLAPGSYEVDWNASNFPSGVYFYRLEAGNFVETKKMLMIK